MFSVFCEYIGEVKYTLHNKEKTLNRACLLSSPQRGAGHTTKGSDEEDEEDVDFDDDDDLEGESPTTRLF